MRVYPMKKVTILIICGLFFGTCLQAQSAYDTPVKKRTSVPAADTSELPDNSGYNAKSYGDTTGLMQNLPIEVIKDSTGNELLNGAKSSLRRDNILADDAGDSTATPLPYTPLYATDALYRVRVWRVIDSRDRANLPYFYNSSIDGEETTRLINVLIDAVQHDSVQAFSPIDDRFTTPISFTEAMSAFGGGMDTSAAYDLEGNITGYQVRQKAISADSIYKYRIKEEWVFNKRDGKTYVRILGIAPLITYTMSDGSVMDNSEHAAFWVYYPELRTKLVRTLIPNPLNAGGRLSWEEVFENRMFKSTIIKSSLDAANGFTKWPLTSSQASQIQKELNNLSKRMWENPAASK